MLDQTMVWLLNEARPRLCMAKRLEGMDRPDLAESAWASGTEFLFSALRRKFKLDDQKPLMC